MTFVEAETPDPGASAGVANELDALRSALADEMGRADALNRIAAAIGAGGDLEGVVQAVVEGAVELTGAEFGAFFYNLVNELGESYTLYSLAGAPREAFARYPMPRNTLVFEPTFTGAGVVRSDDITLDSRYGRNAPHHGMPEGHLPVRSYLASPVISATGAVLGGLFFGHSGIGVFPPRLETLIEGVSGQAAAALDALRLRETARQDLEERRRAEAALADGEQRFRLIAEAAGRERLQFALEAGRLGSWELDVESREYEASDLCKANYGRAVEDTLTFDGLVATIHPDDRERMAKAIEEAIQTGAEYDIEYRVVVPSGEIRWLHVRGRAAQTADHGGVRRMAGISLDVTDRKRAEERQRLLLNELNHRVKNTLATVQSIASQTLRSATTAKAFRDGFEARLMALSQTHNLLTDQNWEGASLHDILVMELSPHAGRQSGGGARFVLESDRDIRLNPKAAVALGMAIHELATNAVKYGALSSPTGWVTVRARSQEGGRLILEWIESGGPPVKPPTRRGFGGRLLQQGLAGELAGQVRLDYDPAGVSCRMDLPMQALELTE